MLQIVNRSRMKGRFTPKSGITRYILDDVIYWLFLALLYPAQLSGQPGNFHISAHFAYSVFNVQLFGLFLSDSGIALRTAKNRGKRLQHFINCFQHSYSRLAICFAAMDSAPSIFFTSSNRLQNDMPMV
jgi:hypothetical protein